MIIQAVGVFAMLLELTAVQWRQRSNILRSYLIGGVLWVIHFLSLGAYTGAVMNAVGIVRVCLFYKFSQKTRPKWILWTVLTLVVVAGVATWQNAWSLLPIVGMLLAAVAMWQLDEQRLRLFMLASTPFWFAYNFHCGSYPGMLNEAFLLVSTVVALIRYRKKH